MPISFPQTLIVVVSITKQNIEQKLYKGRNPVKIQKSIKKVTPQKLNKQIKGKRKTESCLIIHRIMMVESLCYEDIFSSINVANFEYLYLTLFFSLEISKSL